jgi:hypothetical protein
VRKSGRYIILNSGTDNPQTKKSESCQSLAISFKGSHGMVTQPRKPCPQLLLLAAAGLTASASLQQQRRNKRNRDYS